MNEFGEICHLIWNNLQGSPATKSWTHVGIHTGGPNGSVLKRKLLFFPMSLTAEELQESFRVHGSQAGLCRRLSGADDLLLRGKAASKSCNSSKNRSGYRAHSRPHLGWRGLLTNDLQVTSQIAQPFYLESLFLEFRDRIFRVTISFIRASLRPFQLPFRLQPLSVGLAHPISILLFVEARGKMEIVWLRLESVRLFLEPLFSSKSGTTPSGTTPSVLMWKTQLMEGKAADF